MRPRERRLSPLWLLLLLALPAFADEPPDPALLEWLADQDQGTMQSTTSDSKKDTGTDTEAMLEWLAWWQTPASAPQQEDDNEQD